MCVRCQSQKKLLKMIPDNSNQPLVCRLTSSGKPQSKALSYTRVKEIIARALITYNVDPKLYGTSVLGKGQLIV